MSITMRLLPNVERAISIDESAWTAIKYTGAIYDEGTPSKPELEQVPGRLVVRRIPDLNPKKATGQEALFDTWRFHAFFTTSNPDQVGTVAADQIHRRHAIIENVHADLKNSALAHIPSDKFNANAVWLACAVMTFNLTRAAATLTGTAELARATTETIRRKLIAVAAQIATSARRLHLHLPTDWPWEAAWQTLYQALFPASAAAP